MRPRLRPGQKLVLALLCAVGLGVSGAPAAMADDAQTLFKITDRRISESSGLVDLGDRVVTINDSGHSPQVFVLDATTGEVVGVTTYEAPVADAEALAPADANHVWVGDTGGNSVKRHDFDVYRVRIGSAEISDRNPVRYRFRSPENVDIEAMIVSDGTFTFITKNFAGGRVLVAKQATPGKVNALTWGPKAPDYATDAALFPDRRHVLVRGYGQASVYEWPNFIRVGTFSLPEQLQGEGVAIGTDGRILLSSEGNDQPVLQVSLPSDIATAMQQQRAPAIGTVEQPKASGHAAREFRTHTLILLSDWRFWVGLAVVFTAFAAWSVRRS